VFTVLMETILLASAGIFSFGSITLVILLLISDRGWVNGLAYALGYFLSYTTIGVMAVTIGLRSGGDGGGVALARPVVLLVLGVLLLWMGWRNARKPQEDDTGASRFFALVNSITPLRAFAFGAVVTVINFKNLAIFLTALSVVILSRLTLTEKIAVTLATTLIFSLSVLFPVLIFVSVPRQASAILNRFRESLDRNSRAIGIWAPLLFGLLFLGLSVVYLISARG